MNERSRDGGPNLTKSRSPRPPPDLPSPRFYVPRRGTQNRGDERSRGGLGDFDLERFEPPSRTPCMEVRDGGSDLSRSRSPRPPPDLSSPRFYVSRRGTQNRGDERSGEGLGDFDFVKVDLQKNVNKWWRLSPSAEPLGLNLIIIIIIIIIRLFGIAPPTPPTPPCPILVFLHHHPDGL